MNNERPLDGRRSTASSLFVQVAVKVIEGAQRTLNCATMRDFVHGLGPGVARLAAEETSHGAPARFDNDSGNISSGHLLLERLLHSQRIVIGLTQNKGIVMRYLKQPKAEILRLAGDKASQP